jgi:hypothetical protein
MSVDTCTAVAAPVKVPSAQQMVLDVLAIKRKHGVDRVTAGEIREMLERIHAPRRFDKGWVTGRLADLKASDLVECLDEHRLDPLTKKSSQLWRLPVVQMRLVA